MKPLYIKTLGPVPEGTPFEVGKLYPISDYGHRWAELDCPHIGRFTVNVGIPSVMLNYKASFILCDSEGTPIDAEGAAAELSLQQKYDALKVQADGLAEALVNARAQVVAWQGEPQPYSCTIHRAVVAHIDEALANYRKGGGV